MQHALGEVLERDNGLPIPNKQIHHLIAMNIANNFQPTTLE